MNVYCAFQNASICLNAREMWTVVTYSYWIVLEDFSTSWKESTLNNYVKARIVSPFEVAKSSVIGEPGFPPVLLLN